MSRVVVNSWTTGPLDFRAVAIGRGPECTVAVEFRRRDALGEDYWSPVDYLDNPTVGRPEAPSVIDWRDHYLWEHWRNKG